MIIGIPREIKKEEYRVGMTPGGARELKLAGHTLLIEEGAGEGSGFPDRAYLDADADIVSRDVLFGKAELIVKVKEPLAQELGLMHEGQALFTYLHLAPNRMLTEFLLRNKITAIGYETVEREGSLPLLLPMSEIAGRMAPLIGAHYLQKVYGGAGVFTPGTIGVKPAKVVILGAGTVGSSAARLSCALGAETVVLNRGLDKLRRLDELFPGRVRTLPAMLSNITAELADADIVIGAALVPGGRTPVLITRQMVGTMKKGSVIVDVAIDQGGCFETSRPTTHDDPVYVFEGIVHYAVANIPGAFPQTATLALTNATLPYIKTLAEKGMTDALRDNPELRSGLNTAGGRIMHPALADSLSKH